MRIQAIRPGLLVALRSTVTGGVSYQRVDLEARQEGDRAVRRWETTSTVEDPEEHERAEKVRARARNEIVKVCASSTAFGAYLCPLDREAELWEAVKRARDMADEFRATSRYTTVTINVIVGQVAATDQEAVASITGEMAEILTAMDRGIAKLDPKTIRDAATRASELSSMLGDEQIKTVSDAVEQARRAARTIVKRVEKAGEDGAKVLQDLQRGAIERARFAFLDTEETGAPTSGEAMPAVNVARFADLDACEDKGPAKVETPAPESPAASA